MRDEPAGSSLLDAARRALLDEVAAKATGRQRYVALMVANALGIASREIDAAPGIAAAEAALLGGAPAASLVRAIRSGARDADPALHRALTGANGLAAAVWKPERAS
ncbi:DUF6285 domain-containing protein [Lichenibacterium dinghuense]|uniref:DUF6285 domain-containing protein n=1 Tax=Lichenibacterium dinghuense TaxID=2895977 RepID=UPI001F3FBF0D|nr:DUF6285 domain-containing protein [Lichenibacterium sp. 6Y81]